MPKKPYNLKSHTFPEGKELWEWRATYQISRDEIAFLAGVSHSTICRFERGKRMKQVTADAIIATWEGLKADRSRTDALRTEGFIPEMGSLQRGEKKHDD